MEIPLSAQSELNLLKGYVIDKNTNERIYNANILIIETETGQRLQMKKENILN